MSGVTQLHEARAAAGVLTGRFRRVSRLHDDEAGNRAVVRAVARAKQGDREALRYLYIRYADNVYGYVVSIIRDEHEAEDVTQHVFAKLMTVLDKYQQGATPFSGWILRLAHNAAIDHVRVRRPLPAEQELRDEQQRLDESIPDRRRCLRDALETLPDDQRQVVLLRHVVGLSPTEIADRLDRTESSIHGLHHRGRRALRDALVRMDAAPLTSRTLRRAA